MMLIDFFFFQCKMLTCTQCTKVIGDTADIFSMSVEGPQGTFVNPGGYVHEMLTLSKASNLTYYVRPSTEHSWFPGQVKVESCFLSQCWNNLTSCNLGQRCIFQPPLLFFIYACVQVCFICQFGHCYYFIMLKLYSDEDITEKVDRLNEKDKIGRLNQETMEKVKYIARVY